MHACVCVKVDHTEFVHTYIHTYIHTYTLFQHGRIISTRIKYTNLNIYNVSQKIKIIITVLHDCRARVHILSIYYLRNRKHFPCFYRVIETRVLVWENEK